MITALVSPVAAAPISSGVCSPLGQGDVDVQASVTNLEENGYEGWYVIEQGIMLDGEPQVEGPIAEVRSGLEPLRRVAP